MTGEQLLKKLQALSEKSRALPVCFEYIYNTDGSDWEGEDVAESLEVRHDCLMLSPR